MAALVALLALFTGSGVAAQGSAAQANYGPTNTAVPAISGTAQVGQTLTASSGAWVGQSSNNTFTYQWQRCDAAGANCVAIAGATAQTYVVQSADNGTTLRVAVTDTDTGGATTATSAQTAAVATPGPAGAIKLPSGATSIPASSVALPARLIIDNVTFQPAVLTDRGPILAQFHVSDTRGYVIRDVLLQVTPLPYGWANAGAEVRTGEDGWATLSIHPTPNMPLTRGALVMFVRARVEGQPLLAGSSSRRLVQVGIR
ncbi:MAG: hypothetical protein ACYDCH_11685 [Gaiellaceae bacterium]